MTLQTILKFFLAAALFGFAYTAFSIGFFSDDYLLLDRAAAGKRLWDLHYSPLLDYAWKCSAKGYFSSSGWHLLSLCAHGANVWLLFRIVRRVSPEKNLSPLLSATLFAINPLGTEAVFWSCAAGYPLTAFLILFAIDFLLNDHISWNVKGWGLAAVQILAFFLWSWGILLFPLLFLFAFLQTERDWKLLIPTAFVWGTGALLRVFSHFPQGWQKNSIAGMGKLLVGSPALSLLPNVDKTFFLSAAGVLFSVVLMGALVYWSWKDLTIRIFFLSFIVSILPWVRGGNPSARYFYIPLLFLYPIVAQAFTKIRVKTAAGICAILFVILQLVFSFERMLLWKRSYEESQNILSSLLKDVQDKNAPLALINLPDSYGPMNMAMRPQIWFCGLEAFFPHLTVVRTKNCPFIWQGNPQLVEPDKVGDRIGNQAVYEIVSRDPDGWKLFELKK